MTSQARKDLRPRWTANPWLWCGVLATGLVILAAGLYFTWLRPPTPPAPSLEGYDPAITIAIGQAREAVIASPRSAAAWGRLGTVFAAHDLRAEASRCFIEAERLAPADPHWPYYLGVSQSLGDPDAAIPHLERAAQLAGNEPDAIRLWLAEVLQGQGRADLAEKNFREVLATDPRNARALLGLARLSLARDELATAQGLLGSLVSDPRKRQAAYALLAEVQERAGDHAGAVRSFRRAASLPSDPPWPDPYMEAIEQLRVGEQARRALAEKYLSQGRFDDALLLLEQVAKDYPNAGEPWVLEGRVFLSRKHHLAATHAFQEALRRHPRSAEANYYMGEAYLGRGEYAEAQAFLRRAIMLNPGYAEAQLAYGQCALATSQPAVAEQAFRAAIRARPESSESHRALAQLLLAQRRPREALPEILDLLTLDPSDRWALGQLAHFFPSLVPIVSHAVAGRWPWA